MAMIPLTPELFPNQPVYWMDDVGPVVIIGEFAFCCECDCESEKDLQEIFVWIYEKPDTLPDDPDEMILKTGAVAKRNFKGENSTVHIRNFIVKFVKDEAYRKDFMITS